VNENVTAIVLAGGKGKRLGQAKATLRLNEQTLIEDVVDRISGIVSEVVVVTSLQLSNLPQGLKATVVTDIHPGKNALGGVYTGLVKSSNHHNLVVACDMPFLNIELLEHMIGLAADVDIVTISVDGKVEPLHAVYSKECIGHIEKMFANDDLQVSHLLDVAKVRYVGEDELDLYDPEHISFFNINDKYDLARAKKLKEARAE
jgi:molybdenum cofactor guanylyltransferase